MELARKSVAGLPPFPAADAGPKLDLQGLFDQDDGEALMILTAKVRNDKGPVNIEVKVVATASLSAGYDAAALMKSGFEDLNRALGSMFRIYGGGKDVWLRSLDSAEPDEQILAARMIAANNVKDGVAALARLLTDPREAVAEEAAVSLSLLRDERAVPLIIESIKRGDLRSEVRAIETMAAIGGEEARAYLEMTSLGHEVPEVRKVSADALKRMKSL